MCRARVRALRELNPGVAICGLFGGRTGYKRAALRAGGKRALALDHLYLSPRPGAWNWKNGDLTLTSWYRDVGHSFTFDTVHFIEWDLVLFDSCDRLYAHVEPGAVGLTAPTPIRTIAEDWAWVRGSRQAEWEQLLSFARQRWEYKDAPYGCIGIGPCFPRSFLERYSEVDAPDLGNDELRLPLFAQILGYPIVDTGFMQHWPSLGDDRLFNVGGQDIDHGSIAAELEKPSGRRAFHPVRRRDPLGGLAS